MPTKEAISITRVEYNNSDLVVTVIVNNVAFKRLIEEEERLVFLTFVYYCLI
jgi:hypothetical protein